MPMDRTSRAAGPLALRRLLPSLLVCLIVGGTVWSYLTRKPTPRTVASPTMPGFGNKPWDTAGESSDLAASMRLLLSDDLDLVLGPRKVARLHRVHGPVQLTSPGARPEIGASHEEPTDPPRNEEPPPEVAPAPAIAGQPNVPALVPPSEEETPIQLFPSGPARGSNVDIPVPQVLLSGEPIFIQPKRDVEPIRQPAPESLAPRLPVPKMTDDAYDSDIRRLLKPIREVTTRLTPPAGQYHPDRPEKDERPRMPLARELFAEDVDVSDGFGRIRPWEGKLVSWAASCLCHRGMYFEEINLERYGYSFGLAQPAVSAAHFFGRVPALPYLMTVDPMWRCDYTLGHYRPGTPRPLYLHRVPIDPLAAVAQGGVATGLVYLIP